MREAGSSIRTIGSPLWVPSLPVGRCLLSAEVRVRAHVFVAALAFLLDRALEKKLRAGVSSLSSPCAWQALESVRCVELDLGQHRKLCVSRGSAQAAQVLKALRVTQLDPPHPRAGEETAM